MMTSRTLLSLLASAGLIVGTTVGVVGCQDQGPAEEAGENIDDAFDSVGDTMGDWADEAEDAAEDAADSVEDTAEDAADSIEDAADDIRN